MPRTRLLAAVLATLLLLSTMALGSPGARVEVLSDEGDRIVLQLEILDFQTEAVEIEGRTWHRVFVPGEAVTMERGAPALPRIRRSVIVPDDAAMSVRILSSVHEDVPVRVAPSRGRIYRHQDPDAVPHEFGPAYEADAFWPGAEVGLGDPYVFRDHRGVVLEWNAFRYQPRQEMLRVCRQVVIEIARTGPGAINVRQPRATPRPPVRSFLDIYRDHFVNGPSADFYPPVSENGDLLVIAHDDWIPNLDPFVAHKNGHGIPTTVVGVSTIGNDATSIKSYIQSVYDSGNLAFVLLVGDAAQVATPIRNVGYENGAADPLYSKLEGVDDYPEILVGRFSAQSAAEVDTQVQRTIDYETLPATSTDWFKRGTGIASSEGAGIGDEGQSDREHMDEIRSWLLADGYTEVDQLYAPGATDEQVAAALNAGRGIVNYTGHGSATSWGTTGFNVADVDALVNDDMLPFIVSVACNNGEFHHYDKCFAEAWLRATNDGRPTGAVAMYASSVSQSWAPPMEGQDELNLRLTDPARPYASFGALCFAGSSSMMDKYGSGGVEMFDTWIVFGDPSVKVVGEGGATHGMQVTPSDGLAATGEAGDPPVPDRVEYTVRNAGDAAIEFEVVSSRPWIEAEPAGDVLEPGATATVTVRLAHGCDNLDLGTHGATVEFVNRTDHDGDTTRPVSVTVGSLRVAGRWNLDKDPGWSAEGQWEFGIPTGAGAISGLNPDPVSGATGSNVFGANLDGAISKFVGGPYYLTLGPIDLVGMEATSLTFQRWLNTLGPPAVASTLEISGDGTSWATAWSSSGLLADSAWSSETFDVSAALDGSSQAWVRWGYQVVQKIPKAGAGWNVDDVLIEGRPTTACVRLAVDPDLLSWNEGPAMTAYDVVAGDLGLLRGSGGDFSAALDTCLADDTATTALALSDSPPPGTGRWYLVRGVYPSGASTWQPLEGPGPTPARDPGIGSSGMVCP